VTESACPYDEELDGDVISNFDHEIDDDIAAELQKKEAFSRYPGWNFNARVWWSRNPEIWRAEVWVLGSSEAVVEGDSLQEIHDQICARWGHD
jgi:hypothetical protein